MGQSKDTLIGRIKHHLAEVNKHISKPIHLPDSAGLLPMPLVREAYRWLESLEELKAMRKFKRNAPDWYWSAILDDEDCDDFLECKLYRQHEADLQRCFRMTSRPDILKPTVLAKLLKGLKA
jgi:hypothetical protein